MDYERKTSHKISSLRDLVEALKSGKYSEVLEQSEEMALNVVDFLPHINWNIDRYTRNCIAKDEFFELILLCWEKGQKTAIHCHNEQECLVKIISGSIAEVIYSHDETSGDMEYYSSEVLSENEVSVMEDANLFHSLENSHRGRTMSLHLYMKPITNCRVYNKQTKTLEVKQLSYDSFEGNRLK